MTDPHFTTPAHCLIIGFSNVARTGGFVGPTIRKTQLQMSKLRFSRIGLGAALPYAIPPFIKQATDQDPTMTHALLEICTSALAMHPLAAEEDARDVVADCVLTCLEAGLAPAILIHPRHYTRPKQIDFNAQVRAISEEHDIPCLDLAEGLDRDIGRDAVAALLNDETHTTDDGSEVIADRTAEFLAAWIRNPREISVPRPRFRRRFLPIGDLMPAYRSKQANVFGADFAGAVQEQNDHLTIRPVHTTRVLAMSFLYSPYGGRSEVTLSPSGTRFFVDSIDAHSQTRRIGFRTLASFDGVETDAIQVSPIQDLPVTLIKGERGRVLRNLLGPLIVMEPGKQA